MSDPAFANARFARSYGGQGMVVIAGIALTAGTVLSATQSATFRKATEIVPVHVTVRTNGGEIVRGLTAKNFEVFDNGSRREIVQISAKVVGANPLSAARAALAYSAAHCPEA